MDLKQLEYFQRVAELGGFSKAAEVLTVTQPALSRAVRQLEVELRQNLLARNGRGVTLTEEGHTLLERAKDILDHVQRTQQEIRDLKKSPSGRVVLGCSHAVDTDVIGELVTSFRERFPSATLEVIEAKGWTAYDWLVSGRLDIAILYDPPLSPSIEVAPLKAVPLYLVSSKAATALSKDARVSVKQLSEYPLIMPGNPRAINAVVQKAAAEVGIKINASLKIEGSVFILELVRRGHGYTILPKHSVATNRYARKLQLNEIVSPRLKWTLTLATSTQRPRSQLTQQTAYMITELLRARRR